MTTKEDVIEAVEKYAIASHKEGLCEDYGWPSEELNEATEESRKAGQAFRKVLDEFERTLLNKEEKPCNQ